MKASTIRVTWFLLAAAVIGPLAFLGCFLDSMGTCGDCAPVDADSCTPLDHDFHGCFLNSSGEKLSFDIIDDSAIETCNLVRGIGSGMLPGASEDWGFSGDVSQEDWGTLADLTIDYWLGNHNTSTDRVFARFSEDGNTLIVNLDNVIVDRRVELSWVGDECPDMMETTAFRQEYDEHGYAQVSMEAENHQFNQSRETHAWVLSTTPGGFSSDSDGIDDGNMEARPNAGTAVTENIESTSPRLDYHINFFVTGTYAIWLRMWAPDDQSNRVHLGLNGSVLQEVQMTATPQDYDWYGFRLNMSHINVSTTGIHTLSLWMGDDGVKVDKIVLTQSDDKPTGTDPLQSPLDRSYEF